MAPFHSPIAVLFALAAASWAHLLSVSRELQLPDSVEDVRFLHPRANAAPSDALDALDLLNVVVLASVDGKFHALDRKSGKRLWSMPVTSPSNPAPNHTFPTFLQPLVTTKHPPYDADTDDELETYIIEPQSGDIYVTAGPSDPLQRLPFTMPQLVDMSPFSFPDSDNRVFVGRKKTSLLMIELQTGRVTAALDSECPWDPFDDEITEVDDGELDLDELDGTKDGKEYPVDIAIGRTDYFVSIRHLRASSSAPRHPIQDLSFSTYGPNNQDQDLQTAYGRSLDDLYVEPLPNGEVISFEVQNAADVPAGGKPQTTFIWGQRFPSPIVAVFDVVRAPHRKNPFVLLQPRPRLQDVLPSFDLPAAAKEGRFPGRESAYVGLIEETGSLFALSPDHFPLVVFGGAEDHRRKAIDPPPGVMTTNAAAFKTTLVCGQGSTDRRCATGVRPLREDSRSRLARLLDGVPTVAPPPVAERDMSPDYRTVMDSTHAPPDNRSFLTGWRPWPVSGLPVAAKIGDSAPNVWSQSGVLALVASLMLMLGTLWASRRRSQLSPPPPAPVAIAISVPEETNTSEPVPALEMHSSRTDGTASTPPSSSPTTPEAPPIMLSTTGDSVKVTQLEPQNEDAGEEYSDKEGDGPVPGKRKTTRRKRGRRKKGGSKDIEGSGDGAKDAEVDQGEEREPDEEVGAAAAPSVLVVPPTPAPPPASSLVVSDTVLGFGSHGTVVYQGSLQGRAVAVKRLLQDFTTLASREVSLLQDADDHPNVIRYYYQESHANFLYIALELCPASLADIVERPHLHQEISAVFSPKRALQQIASGLRHLHALKIVHRDIKPQNILVSSAKKGESAGHRMLISDFGLCRKLEVDQTSFLPTAGGMMGVGTFGWRAPEILRGEVKLDEPASADDGSISSRGSTGTATGASSGASTGTGRPTRLTKSVDIFALGCLFYYCLTSGEHPFGDRFEREVNILKDARSLDGLVVYGEEGAEAAELIGSMLAPKASDRPDTTACLMHPYFWDSGRRLGFLQDASDRFEIMCRDPRDSHLAVLETGALDVVGPDWVARLDKVFVENLGKFRKYDGRSVQDLLRALRNKKHHYQDLPESVKRHVGSMPEGYLSYFTRRYPRLFLHVHTVIAGSTLRQEPMFRSYFTLQD